MANWYYVAPKTREKTGPHDEADAPANVISAHTPPGALLSPDTVTN